MAPEQSYRLYAVVRVDLGMGKGKTAAQAGHAFLDALESARVLRPEVIPKYKQLHGIKVVLACPSEELLLRAHEEALERGLPCALITDLGYTHFDGVHTRTALGIGPCQRAEVDHVNRDFHLMG